MDHDDRLIGGFAPGLTSLMRASFHFVILPKKTSARMSGVKRSLGLPGKLYVATTAPITVGTWNSSPGAAFNCSSVIGPSVAPKSTVRAVIWRMPPPLPMDW